MYGLARIQARLKGGAARVDMGAAELPTVSAPKVKIKTPSPAAVYLRGQTVHTSFTCIESAGGPGIASCHDQRGRNSGSLLNTSTAGRHTFTVTAVSRDGLKTSRSVSYTVRRKKA